jgi:hypothetical protein
MNRSIVVPIDSTKIVELLFENSTCVSEEIYLHIMNLMKRYYEFGDNENEIRIFISTKIINQELKNKIEKYLNKKTKRVISNFNILEYCSCRIFGTICGCFCTLGFFILMVINIIGVGGGHLPQSPSTNYTG